MSWQAQFNTGFTGEQEGAPERTSSDHVCFHGGEVEEDFLKNSLREMTFKWLLKRYKN